MVGILGGVVAVQDVRRDGGAVLDYDPHPEAEMRARWAIAWPIRPKPMMPRVAPETLVPIRWVGRQPVQRPSRNSRSPSPALRATMRRRVIAMSSGAFRKDVRGVRHRDAAGLCGVGIDMRKPTP